MGFRGSCWVSPSLGTNPLIVPTLCVGMQPVTLRVTTVPGAMPAARLERGASLEAFPRRAWERLPLAKS